VVIDKRGPLKMYFVGKWPDGGKGRLTGRDLVSAPCTIGRAGFAGCAARSFEIRLAVGPHFKEPPAEPGGLGAGRRLKVPSAKLVLPSNQHE
jgi:hypothetical protein